MFRAWAKQSYYRMCLKSSARGQKQSFYRGCLQSYARGQKNRITEGVLNVPRVIQTIVL